MLAGDLKRALGAATIVDEVAFDRPATDLLVVDQPTLSLVLFALSVGRPMIHGPWVVMT